MMNEGCQRGRGRCLINGGGRKEESTGDTALKNIWDSGKTPMFHYLFLFSSKATLSTAVYD